MILVTGGAGYIGTHTCVALLEKGHEVAVLDNFSNSWPEALERVQQITGKTLRIHRGDVRDRADVVLALRRSEATAVVHLAGLKAVGESMAQPLRYYDHNVSGTLHLLQGMSQCGVQTLVFSSSATVYGIPHHLPCSETHPLGATNVYGRTKRVVEDMLRDLHHSDPSWRIAILRYFNPIGAHASGLIGEDPLGIPNNLLPFVAQVAGGRRDHLDIWGEDYATPDGTGVRDYLHVDDLAAGHVSALGLLARRPQCVALNLGTGRGVSVRELVAAFEKASGQPIACRVAPRRDGDVAEYCSDPAEAWRVMGWQATRNLETMCADAWRWQKNNPHGYHSVRAESTA